MTPTWIPSLLSSTRTERTARRSRKNPAYAAHDLAFAARHLAFAARLTLETGLLLHAGFYSCGLRSFALAFYQRTAA
jgi:hypothetical protein